MRNNKTLKDGTQNKTILDYLKTGKTITARQASREFDIDRLASRIKDLKDIGYEINAPLKTVGNKRFSVYSLRVKK